MFVNSNGIPVQNCSVADASCTAKCSCEEGAYGMDCSLSWSVISGNIALREQLCLHILLSGLLQTQSPDVVTSTAQLVTSVAQDYTQLSSLALGNCSAAIINVILGSPSTCGTTDAVAALVSAFSALLSGGKDVPLSVRLSIVEALPSLVSAHLDWLVTDENATAILATNLRFYAQVVSGREGNETVSVPQSPVEQLVGNQSSSVALHLSGAETRGYALIQSAFNLNDKPNLISNELQVVLRSESSQPVVGAVDVVLQNTKEQVFASQGGRQGTFVCPPSDMPANYSVGCALGNMSVPCPASPAEFPHTVSYTCPSRQSLPACLLLNGSSASSTVSCNLVSYGALNTTCGCSIRPSPLSPGSRRLEALPLVVLEVNSAAVILTRSFTSTVVSAQTVGLYTFRSNKVIAATVSTVLAALVVGLALFFVLDARRVRKIRPQGSTDPTRNHRSIESFFDALLPDIFTSLPW